MPSFFRRLAVLALALTALFSSLPSQAAESARPVALHNLSIGRADAPVTIYEYSSYTCPHCATFHKENRPWLINTFVNTGRVRLIFRDYPLDGIAMAGSMLVHSAPKATAEALSETLFAEQRQWMYAKNPRQALSTLAGLAGMSQQSIEKALADQDLFQALLDQRQQALEKDGIDSTPTLTINGRKIAANSSHEELTQAIEAAEAEARRGR